MSIEVRCDDEQRIDEIVGKGYFHLERLDTDKWCLIFETEKSRSNFTIYRKGKLVEVMVFEIDMRLDKPSWWLIDGKKEKARG